MIHAENWIYLDLEKTGSTFLRKKLFSICTVSKYIETRRHFRPKEPINLPKIITVRDPFHYYFSLWSYGLDRKGGVYRQITDLYPELGAKSYGKNTQESFSFFLDYILATPRAYPRNDLENNQPPFGYGCDLYTTRILSMIVPISLRTQVRDEICGDYSPAKICPVIDKYRLMPEVVIRTSTLANDFCTYAEAGMLDFLKLRTDWRHYFIDPDEKSNASTKSSSTSDQMIIKDYFSDYHKGLVVHKCALSLYLLQHAQVKMEQLPCNRSAADAAPR